MRLICAKPKTIKALACQVDEEGTVPLDDDASFPSLSSKDEAKSKKRLLGRPLKVWRCLSPLASLREVRHGRILVEDSDLSKVDGGGGADETCSSKKQTRYCRVFNEKDPWRASSDGTLFLLRGELNRRHRLAGVLFNSAGDLRVVEEGREWEEDADNIEEESVEFNNACSVSSPATQNTTSSSDSSSNDIGQEPPDSPDSTERIFKIVDDSCGNDFFNQNGYLKEGEGERIGIQPISIQLSSPEMPLGFGFSLSSSSSFKQDVGHNNSKPKATPPDPPASKIFDSNLSYASNDGSKASMECDIACKGDRTVVSELTCDDSLSEATTPRTDRDHAAALQLIRESLRNRGSILKQQPVSYPRDPKPIVQQEDAKLPAQFRGSKMDDLISKYEQLAISKDSIEQHSLVAKLQQHERETPENTTSSSVVVDISSSTNKVDEANATINHRDRGFFWRSRPQPQDTSDTSPDDSDVDQSIDFPETPDDEIL